MDRQMDDGVEKDAAYLAREILQGRKKSLRRVLDFGAGEGHLVAAFRALGIEAEGVESSEAGRCEARRRYGIETLAGLPERGARDRDLVILRHSLEHVLDPVGTLRSLRDHLAPDGALWIEVPNVASFEMLRPVQRRRILDLPVHVFHFTPKTLASLLTAAGFSVTQTRLTNPAWLEWLFALRASRRRAATKPPAELVENGGHGIRRHWHGDLLPWIRHTFPGWKFQMLAEPRDGIVCGDRRTI